MREAGLARQAIVGDHRLDLLGRGRDVPGDEKNGTPRDRRRAAGDQQQAAAGQDLHESRPTGIARRPRLAERKLTVASLQTGGFISVPLQLFNVDPDARPIAASSTTRHPAAGPALPAGAQRRAGRADGRRQDLDRRAAGAAPRRSRSPTPTSEIVTAAGLSIPDIFALYGEPRFASWSDGWWRGCWTSAPMVLALGGGAFIDAETREKVPARASRSGCAPISTRCSPHVAQARQPPAAGAAATRATMLAGLMDERHPIYAEADYAVDTQAEPHERVVERITALVRAARRRRPDAARTERAAASSLGERSYDITIGAGLLDRAGATARRRCVPLRPDGRRHRREPRPHRAPGAARRRRSSGAGIASRTDRAAAGRGDQELAPSSSGWSTTSWRSASSAARWWWRWAAA